MSGVKIHPTSVVSKEAEFDTAVEIGPFCVVHGKTLVGANTKLVSHVSLGSEFGVVTLGKDNVISAGAAVGGPPQDLKYKNEPTRLEVGDRNTIREFATINIGTPGGGGVTRIGNDCLIMAYAHLAHDCQVGSNVVISNSSQLAGHVVVGDFVRIGGMCAFNQFVHLGRFAYIAGDSTVNKDILPFTMVQGKYATMRAMNKIGLERAGYAKADIDSVYRAIRIILKGSDTIDESLKRIAAECAPSELVNELVAAVKSSERGIAI